MILEPYYPLSGGLPFPGRYGIISGNQKIWLDFRNPGPAGHSGIPEKHSRTGMISAHGQTLGYIIIRILKISYLMLQFFQEKLSRWQQPSSGIYRKKGIIFKIIRRISGFRILEQPILRAIVTQVLR